MNQNKITKDQKNTASKKKSQEIKAGNFWILRISGIIFLVTNLITVVEMINVNFSSFVYVMTNEGSFWSIFFIFTAILYTTSFLHAIMATGTAAIFGGKNNYTQSVWNCQIIAIITLALYASLQILTGYDSTNPEESETLFILVTTLIMEIFFAVITFFCLKDLPEFSWKNILPRDPNSKLCLKVYLIMLALVEAGSFIYANIVIHR